MSRHHGERVSSGMPNITGQGQMHNRDATLAAVAVRQYGLFTRAQAQSCGFSRGAIDVRIQRRTWIAVDHGVYRAATTPTSYQQRLLAACLAGPAVASHRSAASLWGLPGFDEAPVEVTALRHRRRWSTDVIWHESVRLDGRETTTIADIPVTNVTRTLLDLGSVVDEDALLIAFDDAARRSLTSSATLARERERFGDRRRGSGTVRAVLALRPYNEPIPESVLETEFDTLIRNCGLPVPRRQWLILDTTGRRVARVDFAYPDRRLAIEIDGAKHHAGVGDWSASLGRQNQLAKLWWRLLRFTAADLTKRSDRVVEQVREALSHGPAHLSP
jgi:very-short-patch-repair endonuclease